MHSQRLGELAKEIREEEDRERENIETVNVLTTVISGNNFIKKGI